MGLQIAWHIATEPLRTSEERSAKDKQTAFSNSFGDVVAISGRFTPLLSGSTWQYVSVCLSLLPKCVTRPHGGKRVLASGHK